ncbi:MADS-box transcription factor PHERES 1 [Forsythia ovata]|uniref:MADS-box transcription factor PHERES 1 n=1 Tax=Forsythia ovata TaxID=205694 RepID=A0ABD1SR95_9LAMI
MARMKMKRVKIANETKRKSVLRKRTDGLLKKTSDLATLCDVEIGVVIHTPKESNATLWPSPHDFEAKLKKLLDFPEIEREKKLVIHEKYMEKNVEDETENLRKFERKNDSREYKHLINELSEGKIINELDLNQLNVLCSIGPEELEELVRREEELNEQEVHHVPLAPTVENSVEPDQTIVAASSSPRTLARQMDNLRTDPWFSEIMSGVQFDTGFPVGSTKNNVFPPNS